MLISAAEARKNAINNISSEAEIQLLEVEKNITQALDKGQMSCYRYKYLNNQTISKLQELGYKVENCSCQMDGTMYRITW